MLGGGSAGFTAARVSCKLGARVLFFMGEHADRASLCISAGCMPSKALFEPIDAMHHAKRNGWFKVEPRHPEKFLREIVRWKDAQIAEFNAHRQKEIHRLRGRNFRIIPATARFVSRNEIESAGKIYRFDAAIIASGSVTKIPPIDGLVATKNFWTSDEILQNTRVPKSLAVIGAGPVALEFALRYARLGTRVTLLAQSTIWPKYPKKFGERIAAIFESEGLEVLLRTTTTRIWQKNDGSFTLELERPNESSKRISAEKILVATGRSPAVRDLGLEAAGVALNESGRLAIGDDMRVSGQEHFLAAGDVAGERMIVHHAHIEAAIAAENAVNDSRCKWRKRSNVQVVFTDPEFAFAGMTPAKAKKAGHKLISASAESADIGKLHLAGDDMGFGEFWADAKTHQLIGAGLLCNDASNLIHLPAYAIDHQHTVSELEDAEFYHPTKMEIVSEIGDELCRKLGGSPFARAEE